ncbi:hypothetical protein D9613_001796 [Agrocybe pediades]|uniref:Uncharacterized protein n=1 Tax=Agrocybe pediades TaxID=84607 RepID=A0A8H4R5E0_9AGAR|nr:hypothetical protein D9613_001796 [Agrocybe pediades]
MDTLDESRQPSPPRFYRALSIDAYQQSETSLAARESSESTAEGDLNEKQLRELYDNEEIERFLSLFSDFVTEVQVPDTPVIEGKSTTSPKGYFADERVGDASTRSSLDEGEWTPLHLEFEASSRRDRAENMGPYWEQQRECLSEYIAYNYLLPHLPPARPELPSFTIGRLRIAIQRLYLAAFPAYNTFMTELVDLATWAEYWTSFIYCLTFWTLWWHNLLAPAFVLRVLYGLLRRRIFPYPTLEDLRRHRDEVSNADEFGKSVSARLSVSSSGITELWRLFKLFDNKRKNKNKNKDKFADKDKNTGNDSLSENGLNTESKEPLHEYQETTILDTVDETEESRDMKRIGLRVVEDLADLHERVRNIFIWRRPSASRRYTYVLCVVFLLTLLPAQYIAKLTFFILGCLFWHITPLVAALSPVDRRRLPPPLNDVPTDADYAMELISQRVAAGLEVNPTKQKKAQGRPCSSSESLALDSPSSKTQKNQSRSRDNSVDWKKWGSRLAMGKSAASELRRLKPGSAWPVHEVWPPRHPLLPGVGIALPQSTDELHTYPCQHSSGPGLITLTPRTLLFTPLMSQTAKLIIPLSDVKGAKKTGLLKGLHIRWTSTIDDVKEQTEDKFVWIGSRDELFARLVGSDGKKWMKV